MISSFSKFTLGILLTTKVIMGLQGQEGKDYFYNEAEGKTVLCADFCDPPIYYMTCKEKCHDYMPKLGTTSATGERSRTVVTQNGLSQNNSQGQAYQTNYVHLLLIVAGIAVGLIIMIVIIVKYFKKKFKAFLSRIKEIFCERLTEARQEQGPQEPSQPMVGLNPTDSGEPQASDHLVYVC